MKYSYYHKSQFTRIYNVAKEEGVSLRELAKRSDWELKILPNLGRKGIQLLREPSMPWNDEIENNKHSLDFWL
jgi:hypothetical protein